MAIRTFIEQAAQNVSKGTVDSVIFQITELWNDLQAALDTVNDIQEYESLDGVIGGDFAITAGAAVTLTGAGRIRWRRAGQIFETVLDTSITLGDDGDVDADKWRAWRLEIADTGVVTAVADGDTQHAEEEPALFSLASKARTALTVEIGYFTIDSNAGFNIGTDNVNGETAANIYYVRTPRQRAAGLTADMGAAIAIGSTATQFSHGTIDARTQGIGVAQIAAAASVAFDDNDTIGEDDYGGHLICVDLAGTGVLALAADGVSGSVSAMGYTTAALRDTALDNAQARIPALFPVLGRVLCANLKAGTFTYNTDDGEGTDGTFTFNSETFADFDRTDQSGTGQGVAQPTIPSALDTIVWRLLGTP